MAQLTLEGRRIGAGQPVFIIAELSCNHDGRLDRAHDLIAAAAAAGCDAVKLQAFGPAALAERRGGAMTPAPAPWGHLTLLELYQRAVTPAAWFPELLAHARQLGLVPIASSFSAADTRFLMGLPQPPAALKIAAPEWGSGEIAAATALPLLVSVPPSASLNAVRPQWPREAVALLHCPAGYPARCDTLGLRRILELRRIAGIVGLSDHSRCEATAIAAVALGIDLLEVHVMLNDARYFVPPLDAAHSWRPAELQRLVVAVRHAEASL